MAVRAKERRSLPGRHRHRAGHPRGCVPGVAEMGVAEMVPGTAYVIARAVATTTTQPITLYQSQETSVNTAVARMADSPASIPTKVAVPRARRKAKASTKQPSS